MKNIEKIKKAVSDILITLPNFKDKIYILEDYEPGDRDLSVIYDSWVSENKLIYRSSKGLYINGRDSDNEGRIYLTEFKNPDGSRYEPKTDLMEIRKNHQEELDRDRTEYISSRDLVVGGVYFDSKYRGVPFLYLGKGSQAGKKKYYYIKLRQAAYGGESTSEEFFSELIGGIDSRRGLTIHALKNKKRFVERAVELSDFRMMCVYQYVAEKRPDVVFSELENFVKNVKNARENCPCNHIVSTEDIFLMRLNYVCKDCGKLMHLEKWEVEQRKGLVEND